MPPALTLDLLPGRFAVARLAPDAPVPDWASRSGVLSCVVRTSAELWIIAAEDDLPAAMPAARGYCALRVRGPLPFHLVGVLAGLAQPLADAGVPIMAVSTYDTDYLLVRADDLRDAQAVLRGAGHRFG